MDAEGRILFGELLLSDGELVLIGLRLRLDRDVDDGHRELHRFEDDWMLVVAHRVAGARVAKSDGSGNVAGPYFLDFLALVRMHLEQPAHPLAFVLARVVDIRPGLENT